MLISVIVCYSKRFLYLLYTWQLNWKMWSPAPSTRPPWNRNKRSKQRHWRKNTSWCSPINLQLQWKLKVVLLSKNNITYYKTVKVRKVSASLHIANMKASGVSCSWLVGWAEQAKIHPLPAPSHQWLHSCKFENTETQPCNKRHVHPVADKYSIQRYVT